jgi:hypothetical protein
MNAGRLDWDTKKSLNVLHRITDGEEIWSQLPAGSWRLTFAGVVFQPESKLQLLPWGQIIGVEQER